MRAQKSKERQVNESPVSLSEAEGDTQAECETQTQDTKNICLLVVYVINVLQFMMC